MARYTRFYQRAKNDLCNLSHKVETVVVVNVQANKHGVVKIQPILDGIYDLPSLNDTKSIVVKDTKKRDLFQITSSVPIGQLLEILKERHRLEILSGDLK
jgi:hypothetical protein